MKKIIKDAAFIAELKTKSGEWLKEQSKNSDQLPDMEIIEVAEYAVYNLIYKTLIETRRVSQFKKPGAARPKTLQTGEPAESVDPWSIKAEVSKEFADTKQIVELPAASVSVQCVKCDGSGVAKCPECQGKKSVYCMQCRGDGKLPCEKCRRTLKIHCPSCQGRGKVYSEATQKYEDCSQCNGAGNFPCTECKDGFVTCSACEGKGSQPCHACKEKGDMTCSTCEGMGNIVTGTGIEISTNVIEAKFEVKNTQIPENITGNELAFVRFVTDKTVEIEPGKSPEGLSEEFLPIIPKIESKLSFPPGSRVLRKAVIVEKKVYYNAVYKTAGTQNSVWFVFSAGKFVCEKKLLQQLYAGTVDGMNEKLKKGDYVGAIALAKSVSDIPILKADAERVKSEAAKKLSQPYYKGGLLGFAAALLVTLPLSYFIWRHSYHLLAMELYTLLLALVSAVSATLFVILFKPKLLDNVKKSLTGTAMLVVVPVLLIFFVGILLRLDPARYLDAREMKAEYAAYFPFGLRTLASKDDIEFLKSLIEKYSETGVDLSWVSKDLKWLQDKQRSDELNMAKIERTSKAIEQITKTPEPVRAKTHKRRTYKKLPKIYIN
jgi:hypothetical protein